MSIKDKLSKLFLDKGLTAYELSLRSGVPHSTISNLMTGKTEKISAKTKEKFANYFGISIDYFNNGNNIEVISKEKFDNSKNDNLSDELQKAYEKIEFLTEQVAFYKESIDILKRRESFFNENPVFDEIKENTQKTYDLLFKAENFKRLEELIELGFKKVKNTSDSEVKSEKTKLKRR